MFGWFDPGETPDWQPESGKIGSKRAGQYQERCSEEAGVVDWALQIQLLAQLIQAALVFFLGKRLLDMFRQLFYFGFGQAFTFHNPIAQRQIILFESGKCHLFRAVSQHKPVAASASVVDRWVAPVVRGFGRRSLTGFNISGVHIRQAVTGS